MKNYSRWIGGFVIGMLVMCVEKDTGWILVLDIAMLGFWIIVALVDTVKLREE